VLSRWPGAARGSGSAAIGIHRQPPQGEGDAAGQEQQGVKLPRPRRRRHQGCQHLEQGSAGGHAGAQPLDGRSAVEHLLPVDHHGAVAQVVAARGEVGAQVGIHAAIADLQPGDAAAQLAEHREVAAERAAAIEHQQRMGGVGRRRCLAHHGGLRGSGRGFRVAEGPRH